MLQRVDQRKVVYLFMTVRNHSLMSNAKGPPIWKEKYGSYLRQRLFLGLISFSDLPQVVSMKFENDKGQQVEINFQNFEKILPGTKPGLTPVKFKNGREEWLKASKDEILEATVEE